MLYDAVICCPAHDGCSGQRRRSRENLRCARAGARQRSELGQRRAVVLPGANGLDVHGQAFQNCDTLWASIVAYCACVPMNFTNATAGGSQRPPPVDNCRRRSRTNAVAVDHLGLWRSLPNAIGRNPLRGPCQPVSPLEWRLRRRMLLPEPDQHVARDESHGRTWRVPRNGTRSLGWGASSGT